ncbi:hypothetical protein AX16_001285 [Volvariella volvacea WC 439]|nr:hypothetical protein AX16_001285 [Volvariella volvacea WC 439]
MLTLSPGSVCDVCAEEYGPQSLPHSIPCGHVLCASCCNAIVEKTPSRLSPVCPFCRVPFSNDSIRLIRIDFGTSGWSTPRRLPPGHDASQPFLPSDLLARKTERLLSSLGDSRARSEVRRMEQRVAKVAAKKSSVEEVTRLLKDLEDWVASDVSQDEQSTSIHLSAALLRAILSNHVASSEASAKSKATEAQLLKKVNELEVTNEKLESELRRYCHLPYYSHKNQFTQKTQECNQLRAEVSWYKAHNPSVPPPPADSQPVSAPVSPSSPPPQLQFSSASAPQSPISRFNSVHMRSLSASTSQRPTTPSPSPLRSHTPTPVIRPYTPGTLSSASAAAARSHTPAPVTRLTTPAPPTPTPLRIQTPAPPIPPKPRRLSHPSPPPQMMRSTSEEKQETHQRWLPAQLQQMNTDDYKSSAKSILRPPSRAPSRVAYVSRQ